MRPPIGIGDLTMERSRGKHPHLRAVLYVAMLMIAFLLAGAAASIAMLLAAIAWFLAQGMTFGQATASAYVAVSTPWFTVPYLILQNILFLAVAAIFARIGDGKGRPLTKLGLTTPHKGTWFLAGAAASSALGLATVAVLLLAGATQFEMTSVARFGAATTAASFLAFLVASLFIGLGEEALFRGCLQRFIISRYGIAFGLAASSLIFAFAHTVTYDKPLPIIGVFLASAVMGYLFIATGSLWTSIGFHAAWDFLFLQIFSLGRPAIDLGSSPLFLFSAPGQVVVGGLVLGGWDDLAQAALLLATLLLIYVYSHFKRRKALARQ